MIKNIIFDIGNVLVSFRYKDYCRDLGMDEATVEAIAKAMPENENWNKLDAGEASQEELVEMFKSDNPDLTEQIDLFWNDLTEIVRSFPQSKEWLCELKGKGYGIYLLTNYPEEMFALHCKTQFTFLDYVDGMVVSSHCKLIKPDERIYTTLMSKYNLIASECVFLDDRAVNTSAAASLGMKTITVTSPEQARLALDELLEADRERG